MLLQIACTTLHLKICAFEQVKKRFFDSLRELYQNPTLITPRYNTISTTNLKIDSRFFLNIHMCMCLFVPHWQVSKQ